MQAEGKSFAPMIVSPKMGKALAVRKIKSMVQWGLIWCGETAQIHQILGAAQEVMCI